MHYRRWLVHGDTSVKLVPRTTYPPAQVRFWSRVDKDGPLPSFNPTLGPCWLWTGAISKGYGRIAVDGRLHQAHRLSYVWADNEVLDGYDLDHLCRVRACVNPDHLELVTHAENGRRGLRGVLRVPPAACIHGHAYTVENTRFSAKGKRWCRECSQLRYQRTKKPA